MPIDPHHRTWAVATGRSSPAGADVATPSGLARTWARAVRWPWLAGVTGLGTAYAIAQVLRVLYGPLDETSVVVSYLLVFAAPTLVATLPQTTVLWRVGALFVGLHVGPVVYAPLERLSVGGFMDSWGAAIGGDGTGVLHMFVWAAFALPVLEVLGAWVRRGALAAEAGRRRRGGGLSLFPPAS